MLLREKNEAPSFVYLQSEVLNAFFTLKLCASIRIRQIETNILDESILHSLMVKLSCGINQKHAFKSFNCNSIKTKILE